MTRMTGPDCAVMCNLVNIHTYIHTYIHLRGYVQFNKYTYIHTYCTATVFTSDEVISIKSVLQESPIK